MIFNLMSKIDKEIDIDDLIEKYSNNNTDIDDSLDILMCLNTLKEYQKLDRENKLIKTNIPVGTIVYVCLIAKDQKNDEIFSFEIVQKAFVPGSVYFDMLNNGYERVVFSNVVDAIVCVQREVGDDDRLITAHFPTLNKDGSINDNGSNMLKEFSVYDKQLDDDFFSTVIHTEISEEELLNSQLSNSSINLNTDDILTNTNGGVD